jgi:hypothetical protein
MSKSTIIKMSKQAVFLMAVGSFNPPTIMHLRIMGECLDHNYIMRLVIFIYNIIIVSVIFIIRQFSLVTIKNFCYYVKLQN